MKRFKENLYYSIVDHSREEYFFPFVEFQGSWEYAGKGDSLSDDSKHTYTVCVPMSQDSNRVRMFKKPLTRKRLRKYFEQYALMDLEESPFWVDEQMDKFWDGYKDHRTLDDCYNILHTLPWVYEEA